MPRSFVRCRASSVRTESVGRAPLVEGIGLEAAGVTFDPKTGALRIEVAVDGLGEQSLCLQICAHLVSLPRICCHSVLVSPNSYWSSLELSEAETLCARNVASWRQPCAL